MIKKGFDNLITAGRCVAGSGYAWDVINGIPNLVVGGLLVFAGFKLLNMHPAKKNSDDELPPYPHE